MIKTGKIDLQESAALCGRLFVFTAIWQESRILSGKGEIYRSKSLKNERGIDMSKEFSGKKACIAPEGVFIIGTYDENGVPNAMNAAWGAQSDYGEITLFLAPHKTTDNVKQTRAFTVAFATKDTVEIADYFGVETGRKVNKIEKAGCHTHKSAHVNAPIIEEFPVTLECEMTSYDDATGILVGKIVAEQADESVLTDGKVDYDKLQPIIFDIATMTYRVVGPVVGKAFHDGMKLKG